MQTVVFDIDGTICFDGNNIAEDIQKAIQYLIDNQVRVIFASARSYRDCVSVLKQFKNEYIIGLNGAQIFYKGKLVQYTTIEMQLFLQLTNYCLQYEIPFFIDETMNYFTNNQNAFQFFQFVDQKKLAKHVSLSNIKLPQKLVINLQNHQTHLPCLLETFKNEKLDIKYHEHEQYLYVNPYQCTKATALQSFNSVYTCFGNDKNDIAMFKNAQYAVQVGDYLPLQMFANEVITKQDVAKKIYRLLDKSLYKEE